MRPAKEMRQAREPVAIVDECVTDEATRAASF